MTASSIHSTAKISPEEVQMIKGCLKNRRKDQKALYMKYCDAMYTTAFRITSSKDTANDVLQEAFIKVFKNLGAFRMESSLGAWIKTIVVRTAVKNISAEPLHHYPFPVDDNIFVEMPVAFNGEIIEKAILSLPNGYRTVFLLVMVEGYGHKEVAEMLDISVGTSKSQLYYAKKALQKEINRLEGYYVE